jgi:hypothetical protein
MAKHHRHYRRRHRHNPFGITGNVVKETAYVAVGAVGSSWLAKFAGQSGWLDVGATAVAALVASYAGKFIDGATASEELLKGGLVVTILKALNQAGVSVPGLGSYVPNYFSAPTTSDAYGRASAPVAMLPPAPAGAGGKGMGYGVGGRFRSRFITRF